MGGYGSGRKSTRRKVEDCRSLDVLRLWRAGCLDRGFQGSWNWLRDGVREASIGLSVKGDGTELVLAYARPVKNGERQDIEFVVPLVWVPCPAGGSRPYFRCLGLTQGRPCARPVVKLYFQDGLFHCRHCHQLSYRCQSETRHERLTRRAWKLRRSLDPDRIGEYFPTRPKGMWDRTFEAKVDQIFDLDEAAEGEFGDWLEQRYGTRNMREAMAKLQGKD